MIRKTIQLNMIQDVNTFNRAVCACDFDVDLVSGRYVLDAKSLVGIYTLDLSKPVEMVIHKEAGPEVDAFLNKINSILIS